MNVVFLINTYNRQESCQKLVDALQGLGDIVVLNDGCDYIISGCSQFFLGWHNGKQFYWDTVKNLFSLRGVHKYYIMLPDDFLPAPNMIEEVLRIWNSIQDPQKICLNLYADRIGVSCWNSFIPIDMGEYYKTGWVDMCFLCKERFFFYAKFDSMGWRTRMAGISSGVGTTISRQLFRRGFGLYQVKNSLVIPQEAHWKSQMYSSNQIIKHDSGRRRIRPHAEKLFDTRSRKHNRPGR